MENNPKQSFAARARRKITLLNKRNRETTSISHAKG
jgi:hypothetical protein